MSIVTIKQHPALATFLRRAFPAYRKHKAIINPCEIITLTGGYWDGGSRTTYFAVTTDGREVPLRYNTAPGLFNGNAPDRAVILEPGLVVLSAGTFCGKPATVGIHATPETLAQLGL